MKTEKETRKWCFGKMDLPFSSLPCQNCNEDKDECWRLSFGDMNNE